jgi:hypothetical protein
MAQRTLRVVIRIPQPVFNWPIFGRDRIDLGEEAEVDRLDGLADKDLLRTNSIDLNAVWLDAKARVVGNVKFGQGGVESVVVHLEPKAEITGSKTPADENLILPPIEIPPGSPCGGPLVVPDEEIRTIDLNAGPFCYSSIDVGLKGQLIINGDGEIHVTEGLVKEEANLQINGKVVLVTEKIEVKAKGSFDMGANANLRLYATDEISLGDEGVANTSEDPRRLALFYTGTDDVEYGKKGRFFGTIYAPDAKLAADGVKKALIVGSIVVGNLAPGFKGIIRYDPSLEGWTLEGPPSVRITAWSEQ